MKVYKLQDGEITEYELDAEGVDWKRGLYWFNRAAYPTVGSNFSLHETEADAVTFGLEQLRILRYEVAAEVTFMVDKLAVAQVDLDLFRDKYKHLL